MSVIYILWLRQIKKYLRSKARMIGSLGQPILFLVALGFGFGPIYAKANGGNYLQFIAPGIIAMSILFTAVFGGIEIIWDRQFGFLKETMVAPVSRITIMLGRTLGGATVACFQGIIVFFLAVIAGFRPNISWITPLALLVMFLIALIFTALGTAIATRLEDMQAFPLIMNFLVMPLFFLSGALFPLDNLPRGIEIATHLDPMSYGVDALRGVLTSVTHFGLSFDLIVLSIIAAVLVFIGGALFETIQL
jgi:ABC-2 type transport system permease protein